MSTAVVVMIALATGTYLFKAAGPLLLGGSRTLPAWVDRVAVLLPAPLLAALVLTSTITSGRDLVVDARVVGVATAAVALRLRAPFVLVVVVAAAATALTRAAGLD